MSSFSEEELKNLINDITVKVENFEEIKNLKIKIENLNIQIEENSKKIHFSDMIINVAKEHIPGFDISITAIKTIAVSLLKYKGTLENLKKEIENLENYKSRFLSLGITEMEYSKFIQTYNENYKEEYGDVSQISLENIKNKYMMELLSQEDTVKDFEKKINIEEEKINKLLLRYKVNDYKSLVEYFSKRKNELHDIKELTKNMKEYIQPQELEIEYLVRHVSEVSIVAKSLSDTLIQNKKNSFALESLNAKNKTDEKRDEIIDVNHGKLNDAIGVLKELESVEQRLFDFFVDNTVGILDVFMSIHAPKEFDGLNFSDKKIMLKRIDSEKYDSITKISTGQKSALALSIFLTMNKNAQNSPKYILFDDPVSDIDDINILAFFDFLREIALSGERQIFFATASSKIANLFKKKFDFLGEDFVYHYLER